MLYRALLFVLVVAFAAVPAVAQPAVDEASRGSGWPSQRTGVISPDLRWAATLDDEAVYLWDAGTGRVVWRFLRPPGGRVTYPHGRQLAFSADSRMLAVSPGSAGDVWVLDVPSGHQRAHFVHSGTVTNPWGQTYRVGNFPVGSLAFSPDGSVLAAAAAERVIAWNLAIRDTAWTLWPLEEGKPPGSGNTEMVHEIAFLPDGATLAMATLSGTARFYDIRTRQRAGGLPKTQDHVLTVALSPDGSLAATGGCHRMDVWSVAERRLLWTAQVPMCGLHAAFSPDNRWIVAGTSMAGVRIWDVATGEVAQTLYEPPPPLRAWSLAVRFSADGRRLMVLSGAGPHRIHTWMLRPARPGGPANQP